VHSFGNFVAFALLPEQGKISARLIQKMHTVSRGSGMMICCFSFGFIHMFRSSYSFFFLFKNELIL